MALPADNPEIGDALALLERAEREFPSQRSADDVSEAFDRLNDLLEYDELDDAERRYIENVQYAHCKRIAARLVEVDCSDFETWFHYAVLLLVKMKPEIAALRVRHPDVGKLYDQCLGRHGPSLRQAARAAGK